MKWLDLVFATAVCMAFLFAAGYAVSAIFNVAKSTCSLCGGTGKRHVDGMVSGHMVKCPVCSGTGKRP